MREDHIRIDDAVGTLQQNLNDEVGTLQQNLSDEVETLQRDFGDINGRMTAIEVIVGIRGNNTLPPLEN